MFNPISIITDYSLLKSMIKIPELIEYLKKHNITSAGIIDPLLNSAIPFIKACQKNNIKPIIGLPIEVNNTTIYLYAKNYRGLQNLFKLNTFKQTGKINIPNLKIYSSDLILVRNFDDDDSFDSDYEEVFYYGNPSLPNSVSFAPFNALENSDLPYLKVLDSIRDDGISIPKYAIDLDSKISNQLLVDLVDIVIPPKKLFIPQFKSGVDSANYLHELALKGLNKRFNNTPTAKYIERLEYELNVINEMHFNDYFLIVYDYVLYAKKHDILVGPGRGSGAGSLVCYSLGITNVDPLKYNLYFERFLNVSRITMPDIDIDFEYNKRDLVVNYVKEKYGLNKCSNIITYGTLKAKVCLRLVGKTLDINESLVNTLLKLIDPLKDLTTNYQNKAIKELLSNNKDLKHLYEVASHLENLRHYPSTHAAGVVISSTELDRIIPIYYNGEMINTGVTMEYLEDLGLLKMDFLALKNLTIINDLMEELHNIGVKLDIDNIPLDDPLTLKLFYEADTLGIFQFESNGMINFLKKLHITNFKMIYDALALFRPGPINNIDNYIKNGNNINNIKYLDERLRPILESTNGIIIYQEQIMEILVSLAGYSLSEADLVRRAMSKKKRILLEQEEKKFIDGCLNNDICENIAKEIFNLIMRFAEYGFNKSHSVSYALISYRIAYLKAHYPVIFIKYLLNNSINASDSVKTYIAYLKTKNISITNIDINKSLLEFTLDGNSMVLPLILIKGINNKFLMDIIKNRGEKYHDIYDFVTKNTKILTNANFHKLIISGVFDSFSINRHTLDNNIDVLINYGDLANNLSASLVEKPLLEEIPEFSEDELIKIELENFGFLLRNHQVAKYQSDDLVKVMDVKNYFNKIIKNVFLIDSIKHLKTKNNEDMTIINVSDETGSIDIIAFRDIAGKCKNLESGNIISISGEVNKRFNEYQIILKNIKKLN